VYIKIIRANSYISKVAGRGKWSGILKKHGKTCRETELGRLRLPMITKNESGLINGMIFAALTIERISWRMFRA
jgi:hypothetical protein